MGAMQNLNLQYYPPVVPRAEIPLPEDAPPDCSPRSVLGMHATSHRKHIKPTSSRVLEAQTGDARVGPILQQQTNRKHAETLHSFHHVVLVDFLGASSCALSATAWIGLARQNTTKKQNILVTTMFAVECSPLLCSLWAFPSGPAKHTRQNLSANEKAFARRSCSSSFWSFVLQHASVQQWQYWCMHLLSMSADAWAGLHGVTSFQ